MTDAIGSGRLLLITVAAPTGARHRIEHALTSHVRAADVRHLHDGVFVVYVDAEPAGVRDWLREALGRDASVFVAEFERWSTAGGDVDTRWLLRRGH